MFFQLLINDSRQQHLPDFEAALQNELLERGERAGTWGAFRLPVSEAEHLEGIGYFYIRVYQHRLSGTEMIQLVGDLCERVWANRNACHIAPIVGREPGR